MTYEEIHSGFAELKNVDAFAWAKKTWPSEEDLAVRRLLEGIGSLGAEERAMIPALLSEIAVDMHLEVFAGRNADFATDRRDLLLSFLAVKLSRTREALRVATEIQEKAKALGISSRKLAREAAWIVSGKSAGSP